jgi:hypothetical protein
MDRIADALRAQWRLFERVSVQPHRDGFGLEATIHLNQTLLRGAAEQQCLRPTAATAEVLAARRREAIVDCLERLNRSLAPEERIRRFDVVA